MWKLDSKSHNNKAKKKELNHVVLLLQIVSFPKGERERVDEMLLWATSKRQLKKIVGDICFVNRQVQRRSMKVSLNIA
jgi:hypothetical protein